MFIEDTSDAQPAAGVATGKDPLGGKRKQQAMKQYWDQLSQVVSDESVSVWKQLEKDCQNMKEVLTRRSTLIDSVDTLAKRNAELKTTLNRYLGSNENHYFQVPPGQTIRVRKVEKRKDGAHKGKKAGFAQTQALGSASDRAGGVKRLMSQTK